MSDSGNRQGEQLTANYRSYYLKELPRLSGEIIYGEDYFLGKTSNYEGGILELEGLDSEGQRYNRLAYYRGVARKIASRNPSSVLEVGCAVGYVVRELNQIGIPAQGVDISPWAFVHRVSPRIFLASAASLPFTDKEFDLLFSHDFLEHIPLGELPGIFRELERVACRNYHIISCGSLPDDRDITHVTMMPISWWARQVPSGFEIELKD